MYLIYTLQLTACPDIGLNRISDISVYEHARHNVQ